MPAAPRLDSATFHSMATAPAVAPLTVTIILVISAMPTSPALPTCTTALGWVSSAN